MESEKLSFISKVSHLHRRINPCFMNGKGCVYTEHIDREIEKRVNHVNATDLNASEIKKRVYSGFMILPFQPNILTFFDLCLERYICGNYSTQDINVGLIKADRVRKTGYIICEKICKKIQESDFIVADISVPNANVFYELGLAYGIEQKIVIVHQKKSQFGAKTTEYLGEDCRPYAYTDLEPIKESQFPISNYIWKRTKNPFPSQSPKTLIIEDFEFQSENEEDKKQKNIEKFPEDIALDFNTHVKAAIGVAIDNITVNKLSKNNDNRIPKAYHQLIEELKTADIIKKNDSFSEIRNKIDNAFCLIIKTGGKNCNPMVYFWLGYCHATGKNVIPITILKKDEKDIDDLAFDIRALWHLTFYENSPMQLEKELEEILYQMILNDFTEWSRKRFWDEILQKRGKVSIFTGALHNSAIGREMIGDWDLRAASELTSYFASHQYRATIESPIYQIEQVVEQQRATDQENYIRELQNMLRNKNCIIIASPDVNPMTEIVLGEIYGLKMTDLFNSKTRVERIPNAVLAIKQKDTKGEKDSIATSSSAKEVNRAFYRESTTNSSLSSSRGFKASFLPDGQILGQFVSQTEDSDIFNVHAHLAILKNPFTDDAENTKENKYIIVLNGVSGPATFALTHVLTGGVSKEFVSYDNSQIDPDSASEDIMRQIINDLKTMIENNDTALQYIVEVIVGPLKGNLDIQDKRQRSLFDWRHIHNWKLVQTSARSFKRTNKD